MKFNIHSRLKTLTKVITEAIYDKPAADIILNGEKQKAFLPNSEKRQRCQLSPLLYTIILKILAMAIRQEKEMRNPN